MVKLINAIYIGETQAAHLIEVELEGSNETAECWFPKSKSCFEDGDISKDFYAEQWVIDANSEDVGDNILTENSR